MSETLKPCPNQWCKKSSPEMCLAGLRGGYFIRCASCSVHAPSSHQKPVAIENWNKRALETTLAQSEAGAAKLREALEYCLPILAKLAETGAIPSGGESTGNWEHIVEAFRIAKEALTEAGHAEVETPDDPRQTRRAPGSNPGPSPSTAGNETLAELQRLRKERDDAMAMVRDAGNDLCDILAIADCHVDIDNEGRALP